VLVFGAALTLAACSSATLHPGASEGTSAWTIESTANPSGAATGSLLGVSCPAATLCTAVGYYTNRSNVEVTLAERWNGDRWAIQPTPTPAGALSSGLSGVSCPSPTTCTAIGGYTNSSGIGATLAERWNGSGWTIQATPTPTGASSSGLSSVSCPSPTTCTAVGGYTANKGSGATLAEGWTRSGWAIESTPDASGASFSSLNGVSCPSSTTCTAVGTYTEGTGASATLAERWSSNSWAIQTTPNASGGTGSGLSGVSCPTTTTCSAVGGYTDASGTGVTLAEYWAGSRWAIQNTPAPTSGTFSSLGTRGGVSCPIATACVAVGHYNRGPRVGLTLVERWLDNTWVVQPSPDASGGQGGGLSGVSCPSATTCTAVGGYTSRSGHGVTLAEQN
jgi:hypothetical protein